jgi:steroid 5-alpha-reductase/3-oxo-5-alpha-steroid 4-dehydrogenase 1
MAEAELHHYLVLALLVLSVPTLLFLLRITAPYGRHARGGFGPSIPSRLGWILMEAPEVFLFLGIYFVGAHRFETAPLVLCAFFQVHYMHRTFVFPFRMRIAGKRIPISIPLAGIAFNVVNAYINARWISQFGAYPASWLVDPRFLIGAAIFIAGFVTNWHADTILIHLRKPGESGYVIPRGGMYRWISSPNYFGEIIEWTGWAIMTWSFAGVAFAFWTIANLAPRAISNHAWYRQKFPDYPRERRALIPFVL